MPLCFPQHIKIRNARLQVLSNFLYGIVGAALLWRFVFFQQYGRNFPVQGTGNMVVDGLENVSRLSEVGQSMLSEVFCAEPNAFNFWYDASGSLRFDNHTCLPVCARKSLNPSHVCVDNMELAVPEGPNSVVLVTHVQETDVQKATITNYFVPSVHALGVRTTFAYRVPWVHWYEVATDSSELKFHSSRYDVHTRCRLFWKPLENLCARRRPIPFPARFAFPFWHRVAGEASEPGWPKFLPECFSSSR